jgi:hypothetical protein
MEGGSYTAAETTASQTFMSAWTTELHALGYRSGVYGSETGVLAALISSWGKLAEPDVIDVANWNGQQDDDPGADPSNYWIHHRVHQFDGPANATYGGVTINIDEDYFGLGLPCPPVTATGSGEKPSYVSGCEIVPAATP